MIAMLASRARIIETPYYCGSCGQGPLSYIVGKGLNYWRIYNRPTPICERCWNMLQGQTEAEKAQVAP